MNFTNFPKLTNFLQLRLRQALEEINDYPDFKFPVIDKTNPKYNVDFSQKLSQNITLSNLKITLEVLDENVVEIKVDTSRSTVLVKVGKDLVRNGFFVKDLYLSLLRGDRFLENTFLKTIEPQDSLFFSYGIVSLRYGILVYIPKGVSTTLILKKNISTSLGSFYSMLFVDEGSSVRVFEEVTSETGDRFGFELSEVILSSDSNLTYDILQNTCDKFEFFSSKKVTIGNNSNVELNNVSLGGFYQRTEEIISPYGVAEVKYTFLSYTKDSQKYDVIVRMDHRASNQGADIVLKSILDDSSKVYVSGTLKVREKINNINSYLGSHFLHLSPDCKSDSIPSLEADSFDVKLGHASSVSQLDEEKLFYLMSRGLSEDQARELIIEGFIGSGLDRISDEAFRSKVKNLLKKRGIKMLDFTF